MAVKPISVHLLEDAFVCQCRYLSEEPGYAEQPGAKRTRTNARETPLYVKVTPHKPRPKA